MPRHLSGLAVTLVCVAAGTPLRAQNPMTDAMRAEYPTHEHNIVGAFERMPAEKYTFKPTPELMTFGELAIHIAGANIYYCRRVTGAAFEWPVPRVTPTSSKEQLVGLVKSSFDFCRPLVTQATDASFSGMDHHYGQAAGYLRLNGLVPPTAHGGKK